MLLILHDAVVLPASQDVNLVQNKKSLRFYCQQIDRHIKQNEPPLSIVTGREHGFVCSYVHPSSTRLLLYFDVQVTVHRVQWKTPDDGQKNCLKHVEFYSKNKLEKLVHLVGFIIRI